MVPSSESSQFQISTMAPQAAIIPPEQNGHHHHADDKPPASSSPNGPSSSSSSSSSSESSGSNTIRHTYTHLTYSRHHLIDKAMETIKIAEEGQYINSRGHTVSLKDDLDSAVDNCVHYEHEFDFHAALKDHDREGGGRADAAAGSRGSGRGPGAGGGALGSLDEDRCPPPLRGALKFSFNGCDGAAGSRRFHRTYFLVVSASWLESASELLGSSSSVGHDSEDDDDEKSSSRIGKENNNNNKNNNNNSNNNNNKRVGVLNSGSGTTPGGRFLKGTVSQEDCLCRASLLYSCISQPRFQSEGRFYGKNRGLRYGTSNCVIFSPGEIDIAPRYRRAFGDSMYHRQKQLQSI